MSNLKYFFIQEHSDELKVIYKFIHTSQGFYWFERLGDKLVKKISFSLIKKIATPIKVSELIFKLEEIDKAEKGLICKYIYDLTQYKEHENKYWYQINKFEIHSTLKREAIEIL